MHSATVIKRLGRYGYSWKCTCGAEGKKLVDRYRAIHRANVHIDETVQIGHEDIRPHLTIVSKTLSESQKSPEPNGICEEDPERYADFGVFYASNLDRLRNLHTTDELLQAVNDLVMSQNVGAEQLNDGLAVIRDRLREIGGFKELQHGQC